MAKVKKIEELWNVEIESLESDEEAKDDFFLKEKHEEVIETVEAKKTRLAK